MSKNLTDTKHSPSGIKSATAVQSVTVPAILDGDSAVVAMTADTNFINATAVLATFVTAPETNLGLVAAWVSTAATGVVSLKFSALTGNVAGGDFNMRILRLA